MNKETVKTITIVALIIIIMYLILIIIIGKNLIDDMTNSTKYYKENYMQIQEELNEINSNENTENY